MPDTPTNAPPARLGAGFDFTDPNSPLAPYYCRSSHVVAAALIGLVFVLITVVPVWHTDIWGHLGFGRAIVTDRCLPDRDPLCPYADGSDNTLHYSWLSQTGGYLVYRLGEWLAHGDAAGGAEMVRFGHALVVALRCLVLLVAFRRLGCPRPAALVGLAFVLVISLGNIAVVRPQVIGELFFALVLLALSRPVLSQRALMGVPLLLAVWANVHASFAVGLALLGCVLLGKAIETALRTGEPGRVSARSVWRNLQVRRLALALALSVGLICVANPWGPLIFRNLVEMSANPNVRAMDEWQPLSFRLGSGGQWAYLATILVPIGAFFVRRMTPPPAPPRSGEGRLSGSPPRFGEGPGEGFFPSPTAIILTLLFATQPLLHQRTLVWWLMLAPWLFLPAWAPLLTRGLRFASVPSFRKTLVAVAVVLLAVAWSGPGHWVLSGKPAPLARAVSDGTPWRVARTIDRTADDLPALADHLRRTYPGGRFKGSIFASETLGDYLLWALPDHPAVIYTHVHLFSPQRWRECLTVRGAAPGWEELLRRDHVNLIVVEAEQNPRLCDRLRQHKEWKVVEDETGLASKRDKRCRLFVAVRVRPV